MIGNKSYFDYFAFQPTQNIVCPVNFDFVGVQLARSSELQLDHVFGTLDPALKRPLGQSDKLVSGGYLSRHLASRAGLDRFSL